MDNTFTYKAYRLHAWIWLCFIAFEIVSIGTHSGEYGHPIAYLKNYALHISFFYVHALLVMPFWRNGKKLWQLSFLGILLLEFSVNLTLNYQFNYGMLSFPHCGNTVPQTLDLHFVAGRAWRFVFFAGCATGYFFLVKFLQEQRENQTLERKAFENELWRMDAEHAALKAQINPHFFNNVLNFLYSRSRKVDPELGQGIMLLSKMMQYAIESDNSGGKIKLGSEFTQVENLISIWRLIRNNQVFVEFQYDEAAEQVRFIPLVLLTLAENIFKHGNLRKAEIPARISVKMEGGNLLLSTENLLSDFGSMSQKSTGLDNIRQRLFFEYGDRLSFEYGVYNNDRFQVKATIELISSK